MSPFWILLELNAMEVVMTTGAIVQSSSQIITNKLTSSFLRTDRGCPSCLSPNQHVSEMTYKILSSGTLNSLLYHTIPNQHARALKELTAAGLHPATLGFPLQRELCILSFNSCAIRRIPGRHSTQSFTAS